MFLETLDVKTNDVIIFSQNRFDFEKNFWLIYKNSNVKTPIPINYFDVCEFINNSIPKNLIVYRLLTNNSNIDAVSTKYGYFINISGEMDVIYFDPIFALKDLNHLRFDGNTEHFRFKIQQLGLTSFGMKSEGSQFSIVYNTDLRAYEAEHQNDKIFADAIFALDENYNANFSLKDETLSSQNLNNMISNDRSNIYSHHSKIVEVKKKSNINLNKLELQSENDAALMREKKMNMLKEALGITNSGVEENFISKIKNDSSREIPPIQKGHDSGLLNLFKSAEKQKATDSGNDNFVLKISR